MLFVLGDWRFRTDPAENARGNVPYLCTCQSCRNFLAAVKTLPGETRDFFRRLGLDIRCPTEALVSGPLAPGLRVAFCRRMPPRRGTFRWMRSCTCPSCWTSRGRIERQQS